MTKINRIFSKEKDLSLDLYLEKVLYDKNIGYYQKKNPFGVTGDYVTAPNISNIFSEMIAIWLISFWENLKKPKNFNFVELGPGNGDFCISLLKTLKNFPKVFNAANIMLYEKSEGLKKLQKRRIKSNKVTWIKNFNNIKKGPVVFFGNEFLDALPIKQFKKEKHEVFERYVTVKENKLNFIYKKAIKKDIDKLKNFKLLVQDGIIEYPEYGFKELNTICDKIKKLNGGILCIDYGYNTKKNISTLQSVFKHNYNSLDSNIGNADITYLVNFNLFKEFFNYKGLLVENILSQSKFLQKMGIVERFKTLDNSLSDKDKFNIFIRIKRLIDPKMMGKNFKVIFAKNKKCNFSLAFR